VPGKIFPFRLYAQILIFSGLVALGVLILFSLQRAIQGGVALVRDDLITMLEQRIGRKIHYSSISPSIFGSFDVRNVSITGTDDHPVLTVSRFRIAYSLWDLLRKRPQAIHTVRIDTPLINFDTVRDNDLINLFQNLSAGGNGSPDNLSTLFPNRLMVRIRNGKCLVYREGDQFEFEALNLNVEVADKRMILDGKWDISYTINGLMGSPVSLQAEMMLSGSCRTDMEEGEAVLSIPAITGDAQSASPIAFGLVLEDRIIRVGKMPDNLSMDFSLMYALDNENMDARLECSNFRMGEFFSFHGGLDGVRQFLDIAGSGTASFERGNDGALAYSVDLTGSTPSAGSRPYRVAGASFRIDAEGDEKNAHISALRFSTPQFGNASFRGDIGLSPFAPEGVLSFDNFSLSGAESLSADISIKTSDADSGREIGLFSKALRLSQVYLNDFKALLRPSDDDIDFTVSALRSTNADSGSNSVGTGAVKTAGSFVLKGNMNMRPRRIEAKLRLDSFFAGDIAGMALPFTAGALVPPLFKGLLDGTAITTEAFFATDFSTMSYNAPGFAFNNKAGKGVSGLVSLSGTNRRIDLNHGRFTWGDDHLSLSGKAEFDGPKNINFSVQTDYRNIGYFVEGEITDGNSINIRGSNGLELILTTSGNRGYAGSLRAEGFPVPFLGRPAFVSFAAQIRYDAESSWSVNLEQFDLANISGPSGLAQIRIRGNIDQNGAKFPLLYYQDNLSPLSGMAEFSWAEHFTGSASMWNGRESYHLGGIHADDRSSFSFSGSSMRLERIFGGKFSALADGSVDLVWNSFDSFRAEMNLTSVSGKLYNQEFGAKARAVLDNGELTVSGLSFSYAGLQGAVPRFILSAAKGMVETSISVQGLAIERPIEGGLSLEASFTPLRSWLEIKEALSSFDGKIHFENIIYGVGGETQNFDINFSGSDGIFMVSGGPRNMIRFRMDGEGNFFGGLSSPFPVRGTIAGSINKKIINAHCTDLYVDLAELYALLPITPHDFYLTGGYVNASLDIRGSLTDPEFFGSARGTSLQIRIPNYISKELRPIPFSVAIEGNEMRFGPVDAAVGTGAGKVSGWFLIDRWIPNIFSIDIAVPRETPVPYGLDLSGFTARGDISGNMNISMENQTYDISGEVFANNSALGVNYEEITSPRNRIPFSGVKTPFIVNVKVTTGPVVEFFYPSSRFPVLRANPDMGTVFYVTADSTTRQYSLNGDIKIRSGEIFYFERSFYIRSGVLAFHENELKFAPRLTARAEVRDRTEDGPVTISMFVENAPLLSFTARFESSPPLSQMEILALMGQSITGNQYNETNDSIQRAFLSSTSDLLAQFVLVRQLEQQIRSFTRLDMFSVRTQVIQNAIFMATGLIQQPVDRIATVGNYFDNTTVFGGKYIGQDMFVQGMLSMRYDANRTSLGGLTFAPDFGVELQNPLFSIRWDFNPAHPENWFVNDNSITLTWNKTF
jgi:hypothetical protein